MAPPIRDEFRCWRTDSGKVFSVLRGGVRSGSCTVSTSDTVTLFHVAVFSSGAGQKKKKRVTAAFEGILFQNEVICPFANVSSKISVTEPYYLVNTD